jgi:predicted pyridoxine 5'-phosphate oxidase superfamily flavin-nucleotide-binding protein
MASIYADEHRALQEEFGTTKLAAMLDENWLHDQITDVEKAFIEGRDMFFLSTVDPEGNPTVSYKGGPTGFVKVLDDRTLVFPGYDGNGMFYSMGNIVGQGKVGMLFIDFETPHRVRVQGTAEFLRDHPLMAGYTEAKYLVRVTVEQDLGELPALHPPLQEAGSVQIRAEGCVRNAACAVEAPRHGAGRAARARKAARREGGPDLARGVRSEGRARRQLIQGQEPAPCTGPAPGAGRARGTMRA